MKHLSLAEIAVIKGRILRGDRYAEIAADYRINQGRIADLKFGRIFRELEPAELIPAREDPNQLALFTATIFKTRRPN
jgi:hypothetical protein